MSALAKLIASDHDVVYPDLDLSIDLDEKGKPTRSWMHLWTQEERTAKFFEFCRAYDLRQDTLLKENYQQLSHRLHWHECPFVDLMKTVEDPRAVITGSILFSFTNEHWRVFNAWFEDGFKGVRDYIYVDGNRHSRHDLFQIYYPKGTRVEEWLVAVPQHAGKDLKDVFTNRNRPYSMMEFAKVLNQYFVEKHGFRNAMYPCKNAARHIAMSHPEWVDPDSFLHGGTGFFDGMIQVFDCPNYMSRAKYSIDEWGEYRPENEAGRQFVNHIQYLVEHPDNPIHTHKYLNVEDKLCMSFKYLAMKLGYKKQTKQIPYDWVYPNSWSLSQNPYVSYTI
jgi:hypothetical protein